MKTLFQFSLSASSRFLFQHLEKGFVGPPSPEKKPKSYEALDSNEKQQKIIEMQWENMKDYYSKNVDQTFHGKNADIKLNNHKEELSKESIQFYKETMNYTDEEIQKTLDDSQKSSEDIYLGYAPEKNYLGSSFRCQNKKNENHKVYEYKNGKVYNVYTDFLLGKDEKTGEHVLYENLVENKYKLLKWENEDGTDIDFDSEVTTILKAEVHTHPKVIMKYLSNLMSEIQNEAREVENKKCDEEAEKALKELQELDNELKEVDKEFGK